MDKQYLQKKLNLPSSIQVNISKGTSGVWIADIPEYDIFTEVDNPLDIEDMVNDLLFVFFDVPKEFRQTIRYRPGESKRKIDMETQMIFQKFISSEIDRLYR